jgi:hypothetical protein
MIAERDRALERQRLCDAFEAERQEARRLAVRTVVRRTQQLGAVAPQALVFWDRRGADKTALTWQFVEEVRERRVRLDLSPAQWAYLELWAEATFEALTQGVADDFLHALITSLVRGRKSVQNLHLFGRALSLQLQRLSHVIARHAPPPIASAGPRLASNSSVEELTAA